MAAYVGYIPPDTELFSGDYTTSPSGMYYGMFAVNHGQNNLPNGYDFWIVPGSNPGVAGCCNGYDPTTGQSDANLGGFFARMQTDGNFVVYTSATGTNQGTVIPVGATNSAQSAQPPYFAQVGDDGSFTIYSGSSPASNSGSAFTSANNSHGAATGINLQTIDYDYSKASFTSLTGISKENVDFANTTNVTQQYDGVQTFSISQTASFSFSVSDAVSEGISANVTWGIPGIAKDSLGFSVTNTTTITHGHADSTTTSVSMTAGARPIVPPGETYNVTITGTAASYEIPYSWSGVATYADGATANVVGSGVFKGASEGNFQVVTSCVIAVLPETCALDAAATPSILAVVPEPASAILLSLGLAALAFARRLRRQSSIRAPAVLRA